MKTVRCVIFLIAMLSSFFVEGLWAQAVLHWKCLLVSGFASDGTQSLANWDRARLSMHAKLISAGIPASDIRALSSMGSLEGSNELGTVLGRADKAHIAGALQDLNLKGGDALFVFLSSHGSRNEGFRLEDDSSAFLSVKDLGSLLDRYAGGLPVVLLVSACYSGQFIDGEDPDYRDYDTGLGLKGDSRIILTAARRDRSSFGCGSGSFMPEWDDSLLRGIAQGGSEPSWKKLSNLVEKDINDKERNYSETSHSYPQAWFGPNINAEMNRILFLMEDK